MRPALLGKFGTVIDSVTQPFAKHLYDIFLEITHFFF